ncbi:MAG: DUF3782 domain-containing protein [Thermodesulfobacteriota bacterium]
MGQEITLEEVWKLFQATDRRFQETERLIRQGSRETDRKFQDTDRKIKEVSAAIGRLGNRLGDFVEEMVRPAVVRLFRERGIEVHQVIRGVSVDRGGETMEIDLLVVNDQEAVAVECKSTLSVDDVTEHLDRLSRFKRLAPQWASLKLMGAVAAMVLPDEVARHAHRQGLFVLAQSGETVIIRNDAGFVPSVW